MELRYDAGVPKYLDSQSTGLLLEDKIHSTRCHKHTAKFVFKRNNYLEHHTASYNRFIEATN